ncbi:hypothetical protein Cgig2_033699 [Carnegiea gigantea]|uniref:Uncharacterized protein n=1 Tax=Carnegiea gigantea TaxID=171969 RepID=A0A9Q1K619_9CARY|nr:hypothetical protein Cgig2_033699 [Carnegiea gigantea]
MSICADILLFPFSLLHLHAINGAFFLLDLSFSQQPRKFQTSPCFTKASHLQNPKNGQFLRVRAVGETSVSISERESHVINGVNGSIESCLSNGNGGVVKGSENGARNGSFLKYVNGNGVAETKHVDVSDVLECALNFSFKYAGGMTEDKKRLKCIVLAKWLKENILRLAPTFIKIDWQFSTRVDILAQEYVYQLSELQAKDGKDQLSKNKLRNMKVSGKRLQRSTTKEQSKKEGCWESGPSSTFSISDTAVSIVEEELGAPVGDVFERLDYEPIAAAILGPST